MSWLRQRNLSWTEALMEGLHLIPGEWKHFYCWPVADRLLPAQGSELDPPCRVPLEQQRKPGKIHWALAVAESTWSYHWIFESLIFKTLREQCGKPHAINSHLVTMVLIKMVILGTIRDRLLALPHWLETLIATSYSTSPVRVTFHTFGLGHPDGPPQIPRLKHWGSCNLPCAIDHARQIGKISE